MLKLKNAGPKVYHMWEYPASAADHILTLDNPCSKALLKHCKTLKFQFLVTICFLPGKEHALSCPCFWQYGEATCKVFK